jgi:hypothetical protein
MEVKIQLSTSPPLMQNEDFTECWADEGASGWQMKVPARQGSVQEKDEIQGRL